MGQEEPGTIIECGDLNPNEIPTRRLVLRLHAVINSSHNPIKRIIFIYFLIIILILFQLL